MYVLLSATPTDPPEARRLERRPGCWSGALGPDIDQAADLTVERCGARTVWTDIAQGGMETRSVVDLVDKRAL